MFVTVNVIQLGARVDKNEIPDHQRFSARGLITHGLLVRKKWGLKLEFDAEDRCLGPQRVSGHQQVGKHNVNTCCKLKTRCVASIKVSEFRCCGLMVTGNDKVVVVSCAVVDTWPSLLLVVLMTMVCGHVARWHRGGCHICGLLAIIWLTQIPWTIWRTPSPLVVVVAGTWDESCAINDAACYKSRA